MSNFPFVLLPLWILLTAFVFNILFWTNIRAQFGITLVSLILFLITACGLLHQVHTQGIQVVQIGGWPAPFGISMVADLFASIMVLITAIIAFAIIIYAIEDVSKKRRKYGFYQTVVVMLFGVCGSFLTGDVFNLYVWFEIMLVASFVLIVLGNKKAQLEGAVKYVILNFISSGFILTGIGILYNLTGTLNMAELSIAISAHPDKALFTIPAIFFFVGLGIKAGLFPLFSWLPASYPTPPLAISGLMAGLLTKVGIYVLIRFFTLLFTHDIEGTHTFLLMIAALTMFFGVLGALAQKDLRKILSFHIVSQIGYMLMGLALFSTLALAGAIFYIIHHILVKTNLFLISGIIKETNGHYNITKLGGIYRNFPSVSMLFIISAFSLAGIPPLSGFWGKFLLAWAGFEDGEYLVVTISLIVGFLTLFSMTKIWVNVFWAPVPDNVKEIVYTSSTLFRKKKFMLVASAFLALLTLFISFYPEALITFSQKTAAQLLNPGIYIDAVLQDYTD